MISRQFEKKSSAFLSTPHIGHNGTRVVPSPVDDYDVSVLLSVAEWYRRDALFQFSDYTITEVETGSGDANDAVIAVDVTIFHSHELHYRSGAWVPVVCDDALEQVRRDTLARYIQRVWDAMPRDGDEAALLEALLNRGDRNAEDWLMADEVAKRLGIPNVRSYGIITEWDFWDYGVSARTGWFEDITAARKRLTELTSSARGWPVHRCESDSR